MTISDLLASLDTMTAAERVSHYSGDGATEQADWDAFRDAAAVLACGGEDSAGLMRLVERHGSEGIIGVYMAWRRRRIEAREPVKARRRR